MEEASDMDRVTTWFKLILVWTFAKQRDFGNFIFLFPNEFPFHFCHEVISVG